jgi:hypothetical protein
MSIPLAFILIFIIGAVQDQARPIQVKFLPYKAPALRSSRRT